jgi:hypothetical protein
VMPPRETGARVRTDPCGETSASSVSTQMARTVRRDLGGRGGGGGGEEAAPEQRSRVAPEAAQKRPGRGLRHMSAGSLDDASVVRDQRSSRPLRRRGGRGGRASSVGWFQMGRIIGLSRSLWAKRCNVK